MTDGTTGNKNLPRYTFKHIEANQNETADEWVCLIRLMICELKE